MASSRRNSQEELHALGEAGNEVWRERFKAEFRRYPRINLSAFFTGKEIHYHWAIKGCRRSFPIPFVKATAGDQLLGLGRRYTIVPYSITFLSTPHCMCEEPLL